jgi:putative hemolysin
VTATLEEVITLVNSEHFSRIPVYDESIDDIIGVLHVKDLLPRLLAGKEGEFNLKNLIRTPLYVPISREPHNLLKDMNSSKNHMAVVIDEYGGTAGIVTIEDLLEEIVGDIIDDVTYIGA